MADGEQLIFPEALSMITSGYAGRVVGPGGRAKHTVSASVSNDRVAMTSVGSAGCILYPFHCSRC